MNKILKTSILGLAFVVPVFMAGDASATEQINEIHISSHAESAQVGKLLPFDVVADPGYISAEDYGSNTSWSHWEEGVDNAWHGFGDEEPTAVQDGKTHYALRVLVTADEGYVFSDNPTILFTKGDSEGSEDYTNRGYSTFTPNEGNTDGYVYIDLGYATTTENSDTFFDVTYDFNGGATFDGEEVYVKHMASVAPALSIETLIECFDYSAEEDECHPLDVYRGKELDYVTVNGERHDLGEGDGYMLDRNTTIVYYWSDAEPNREAKDEAGNSISFYEPEARRENYTLTIESRNLNMTDEELEEIGWGEMKAFYELGKNTLIGLVGDEGDILTYMEIRVCDATPGEDYCPDDGPFTVRLKLSDDMKGYDIYKLMYADINIDEGSGELISAESEVPIVCDLDGDDYVVCVLPHLSGYALIGFNETAAPNTGVMTSSRETSSESIILAIIVATTFISAGAFIIVSESRR